MSGYKTSGGGGSGGGGTGFTDAFTLNVKVADSNTAPTDNSTFAIALLKEDTNAVQAETAQLKFPSGVFGDSSLAPTEGTTFVVRSWASGCTGNTANLPNPGNANGANDGVTCNVTTNNALGDLTNPVILTTGSMNFPGGTVVSSLVRIWFRVPANLVGDVASITATSSGGYSATLFTATGLSGDINHLSGDFTFDTSALTPTQLANLVLKANYLAAVVAIPITSINIDAWAIDSTITL